MSGSISRKHPSSPAVNRLGDLILNGVLPSPEADLAWFREQGHEIQRVEDLPPEEIPCPVCHTAGTIRREIPLLEALRQLNIQPQPYIRVAA